MRLPDEAMEALVRTIGVDGEGIAQRRALLALDAGEVQLLGALQTHWPGAGACVERFYDRLTRQTGATGAGVDRAALERLKRAHLAYFDALAAGDYAHDHVPERLRLGVLQRQLGFEPQWYLGICSEYLCSVWHELADLFPGDLPRLLATCSALHKVITLDAGLVFDAYLHADRRIVLGLRGYADDIIACLPNGLAVTDADLGVITANETFHRLFGARGDAGTGGRRLDAIVPLPGLTDHARAILGGHAMSASMDGRFGDKWLRLRLTAIRLVEQDEEEKRLLVIADDITEQKAHAARVEQLAFYDSLTGLPNRALFMERLAGTLAGAVKENGSFAVLFMDLDRFKEINDTQGHVIGNHVLEEVGDRFRGALRAGELVARLGGDEFAMLVPDTGRRAATEIAGRLVTLLAEPLAAVERTFALGISVGIAVFPDDGRTADELIKRADIAMYRAKAEGVGYRLYRPEMSEGLDARVQLARSLSRAIEDRKLELHYQPQLDLRTGELIGAEALLRWHDAELGQVSPAEFIPVAEERGMMHALGGWVIETACNQLKAWERAGLGLPGRLAFNLSAQQLEDADIARKILQAVQAAGLKPTSFEIELTESGLMKNVDTSIAIMETLKASGFTFALDDFGSGYSSLSYLQRLPVDRLKIDTSFVHEMLAGSRQRTIVSIIISMARSLGLRALAEGVETQAQVDTLLELGCTEVQGYWFGRPAPANVFAEKWLVASGNGADWSTREG